MSDNLIVTTGAAARVPFDINQFFGRAGLAIDEARQALDDMYLLRPNIPEASATPGTAFGNIVYTPPGQKPVWNFTFNPPQWNINDPVLETVTTNTVQDFTGAPPAQISPNIPGPINPTPVAEPGAAPNVSNITIPDAPDLSIIADPKEWAISLPSEPTITIPTFSAVQPSTGGINIPSSDVNWSENPYTSETLDCVIAQVNNFCAGGVGIPDPVWEMIWAKENDRENRAGSKLIEEINSEWSNRGFQLPQGVQTAQIQEVYQNLQSTSADRSRDIAIRESDLAIENLKFAVTQGIALETLRGSWYQATVQRSLDVVKFTAELSISVFNAQISFYNAQVQMYLAEVQIYRATLEAELADLEVYKSTLEGQKIIGDLNMQQVQKYTAQVQALNIEIDRYNAILNGVKITTETDAIRVDAYRSEVQAYGERIKAINAQYDGYATEMQGAKIQAEIHDTNVKAFASTVQAYATKVDAEATATNVDIEVNKYKLAEYNAKIQAFIAELEAEVKNLEAASAEHDATTKAYIAEVNSGVANVQAQQAKYSGDIQLASQTTQANIETAKANAQNAIAEAGLVQSSLESIAKVEGALAGSAMSAVNISEVMSDSASNSASA